MFYTFAEIYEKEAGVDDSCIFTDNSAGTYDPANLLIFQMKVKKIERYFTGSRPSIRI